jgi:competence protein ComEA
MKPSLRESPPAPEHSGARGLAARIAAFGRSAWGGLVVRGAAAVAGLALLGLLGSSALARGGAHGVASPAASATAPEPAAPSAAEGDAGSSATVPEAHVVPESAQAPPEPPAQSASSAPSTRATPDDPVVLNTATHADLRRLPGVGDKRAEAILALRTRLGRFRQLEDLLKVKGVGRAMLKRLRPLVRIDAGERPHP